MFNKKIALNKIFTHNTFDIECFINNVSSMGYPKDNYELEIRIVDNHDKISCSLETYNKFPTDGDEYKQILYSDNIEQTLYSQVAGVRIRKQINNSLYEKKTNITTLSNLKYNEEMKTLPIIIKLNTEQTYNYNDTSNINNKYVGYQRKQRISYCSVVPLLKNWRIDKTVRFYTTDINDMKLSFKLNKDNVVKPYYYDALDIEFEYIGDYVEFENSLLKLFEYVYKDDFRTFNITYNEINNIMETKYNINLSSISSEVGIVTNKFISSENLNNYVYEEKFDGEKTTLIIYKNNIYEYTKKYFKSIYEDDNERQLTIIDCEKVNSLYIIFDCLMYEDEWLNNFDYSTRLKYCQSFVNEYKNIINCHKPKCYPLNNINWSNLLTMAEDLKHSNEIINVNVDGLILHKINTPFINGEIYKLKNSGLMTTDFLLKWVDDKQLYYIYLVGFPNEVKRRYSIINPYSDKHFGYSLINRSESSNILFDNPYIYNIYEFKPDIKWMDTYSENNKYYTDEHIKQINKLINEMIIKPLTYNDKIVELSLYKKSNGFYIWLPMRVRNDKIYPNGYRVGLSNIETIYNKLSISDNDKNKNKYNQDVINKRYKQIIDKLNIDKSKSINIIININDNSFIANNISCYLEIDNLFYISKNKTTLIDNFNNIQNNSGKIINVECVYYEDIKYLYNKLLYSSFVPKSINLFIDNSNISIDENIPFISNIMNHKGIYINITDGRYIINNQ